MKWQRMLATIVLNIFLMLMMSVVLEYSNLTERFVSVEDSVQEALDMAISASVHSEEFFTAQYQQRLADTLLSYAGNEGSVAGRDTTAEATTLVWLEGSSQFAQVNTYQLAKWYESTGRMPDTLNEVTNSIATIGNTHRYGLVGEVFEWLYGGVGSGYNSPALSYANRNSAKIIEYSAEAATAPDSARNRSNYDFRQFYNSVGKNQQTVGYLKEQKSGTTSYALSLEHYPVLQNMGLSWMGGNTSSTSTTTSDNLCSSLHVGKSRAGSAKTYYFLTPSSLGVTYVPVEVLKPVFIANLDTLVRLNKLGASSHLMVDADAPDILNSASDCVPTSVFDFNGSTDRYNADGQSNANNNLDVDRHAVHQNLYGEDIVTDGLVEFDLSSAEVKIDYFYHDFTAGDPDSAKLISKLNGTLTTRGSYRGSTTEDALREDTLKAFIDQDSARYVSPFRMTNYWSEYEGDNAGRVIARVTVKIKVHVPYQSSILQWASHMFTGTSHYDIKRYDPVSHTAFTSLTDSDGLWYQYTTYFCTSRS